MLKQVLLPALFSVFAVAATAIPACARSGDMFDNKGYTFYNRPPVPSDADYPYTRDPDLFPHASQYVQPGKDVFDNVNIPANPGIEARFSAHMNQGVPLNPMFHRPDEAYYP